MPTEFARQILAWYGKHARRLPWRGSSDPYAVWVSEIMLQQTRVETVIPYYERWMNRFPTIGALAAATDQDVLKVWEGLGYYSRARNLHKAAQTVVEHYHGTIPQTRGELEKLPGVGRYTAGAIASMAFGLDEPALDGNLKRVLARVFNLTMNLKTPEGQLGLEKLLAENLPPGQAGDFNQAMMDLGATICTPRDPQCTVCPVNGICLAKALNVQTERPVTPARLPVPHHTVTAAVIQRDGRVLITRRPVNGLLGGMWEFPGGKQEPGEMLEECLVREIREELGVTLAVGSELGVYKHAYTHFKVTLHAFWCALTGEEPRRVEVDDLRWVLPNELSHFPMGKIDRQISRYLHRPDKI